MEDFLILFSFTIHAPGHVRVSSIEHSFHPKVSHPLRLRLSLRPRKSFAYAVRQPPSSSHAFCPLSPLSLCLLNSPSTECDGRLRASRPPTTTTRAYRIKLWVCVNISGQHLIRCSDRVFWYHVARESFRKLKVWRCKLVSSSLAADRLEACPLLSSCLLCCMDGLASRRTSGRGRIQRKAWLRLRLQRGERGREEEPVLHKAIDYVRAFCKAASVGPHLSLSSVLPKLVSV